MEIPCIGEYVDGQELINWWQKNKLVNISYRAVGLFPEMDHSHIPCHSNSTTSNMLTGNSYTAQLIWGDLHKDVKKSIHISKHLDMTKTSTHRTMNEKLRYNPVLQLSIQNKYLQPQSTEQINICYIIPSKGNIKRLHIA